MKIRTVLITVCSVVFTISVWANGPGMDNAPTSNNSGGMNPERERWTRQRLKHLHREHQKQEQELKSIELGQSFNAPMRLLNGQNPFSVDESDRRHDAITRQREINTIEFLAIKKERGELTPAGQRKLNALIRKVRAEGR